MEPATELSPLPQQRSAHHNLLHLCITYNTRTFGSLIWSKVRLLLPWTYVGIGTRRMRPDSGRGRRRESLIAVNFLSNKWPTVCLGSTKFWPLGQASRLCGPPDGSKWPVASYNDLSAWRYGVICPSKTNKRVKLLTQNAENWICTGKWAFEILAILFLKDEKARDNRTFLQ